MKTQRIAILLLLAALLVGCGKPVPAEKVEYVGDWRAEQMRLLITRDGSVVYKRIERAASKSIEGRCKDSRAMTSSSGSVGSIRGSSSPRRRIATARSGV